MRTVQGLLSFVLLLCLPTLASSTPKLPDTAPARLLSGWLEAFNSGDAARLTDFIARHYSDSERQGGSPEQQAEREIAFRNAADGGFDLLAIEKSTPQTVEVIFGEKNGMAFWRALFQVDSAHPTIIEHTEFRPASPPRGLRRKLTLQQLTASLDTKLVQRTANDRFSGVVLIAKDGRPVWQKAYGSLDRAKNVNNAIDTKFRLASQNKMFTAIAIAQLVEAGKLKFSDTVAQLLPDYPNQEIAKRVTVHHLLTHTSGIADFVGPEFRRDPGRYRKDSDFLPLFADKPLGFEPGSKFRYSNGGFVVLGLIIEKITGQSYYDYMKRNVFDPAGMMDAGFTPTGEQDARIAVGYTRRGRNGPMALRDSSETLPGRGMSALGCEGTASDLLAFGNALLAGKLVSKKMGRTLTQTKVNNEQEGGGYGYGFATSEMFGHSVFGHAGTWAGMNTDLLIVPDTGYTIVVLSNLDPPAAQQVSAYIASSLL